MPLTQLFGMWPIGVQTIGRHLKPQQLQVIGGVLLGR